MEPTTAVAAASAADNINPIVRAFNEGGFVMEKPKASPRKKYNTDVERREAHNAPRRKPPKTIEALACDAINEAMERKKKKNG